MERIKEIFAKLKQGHEHYKNGDDAFKKRIEKAFEPMFDELETLGVARHFSEALLFFGKEFVDSVGSLKEVGLVKKNDAATIQDAELIFGTKATPMNDLQRREAELARKHGALVWQSVKSKTGKPSIRVLTYMNK